MGRFLSPDKVQGQIGEPQSWNRYAYAGNNPLKYVDRDGDVKFATTEAQTSYAVAAEYLSNSPAAYDTMRELNSLKGSDEPTLVTTDQDVNMYVSTDKVIYWNPNSGLDVSNLGGSPGANGSMVQTPAIGLLHEAAHAVRNAKDPQGYERDTAKTQGQGRYSNAEERRVVQGVETKAAKQLGEPTRKAHGGEAKRVPMVQPSVPPAKQPPPAPCGTAQTQPCAR